MKSLTSLLDEPRVPNPPAVSWRDWVLVAVLAFPSMGQAFLDDEIKWPVVTALFGITLLAMLPWRRSHPLLVIAFGFGSQTAVDAIALFATDESTLLEGVSFGGLVITFALFRWASGRHVALGMLLVLSGYSLIEVADQSTSNVESLAGSVVWFLAAAVGLTVRYRAAARGRAIDEARNRERQTLARELHDSVAHHVSAIAIQAQAGRTVAASSPEMATEVLGVIEEAASRALREMRAMVGALREGTEAEMSPARGVAEIEQLASSVDGGTRVDVKLTGDFDGLATTVNSTLYRVAQESITNARRHSRNATRIRVDITAEDDSVYLSIADDGDNPTTAGNDGYGLVGMRERAKIVGGTFDAGPGPDRGWLVQAAFPRDGIAP